jgi:hypothetical protein
MLSEEEKTMCDYSLMSIPNRLAVEGETLIARRFTTGTMGLVSPSAPAVCVCIPPGARLVLHDIPERLQHNFAIGPMENVMFVQLSAAEYMHRDAIRFQNGREILLQKLSEGQGVRILDMSSTDDFSFGPSEESEKAKLRAAPPLAHF